MKPQKKNVDEIIRHLENRDAPVLARAPTQAEAAIALARREGISLADAQAKVLKGQERGPRVVDAAQVQQAARELAVPMSEKVTALQQRGLSLRAAQDLATRRSMHAEAVLKAAQQAGLKITMSEKQLFFGIEVTAPLASDVHVVRAGLASAACYIETTAAGLVDFQRSDGTNGAARVIPGAKQPCDIFILNKSGTQFPAGTIIKLSTAAIFGGSERDSYTRVNNAQRPAP